MKKKIIIISVILVLLAILSFLAFGLKINKEDLNLNSKFESINTKTLKEQNGLYVLYIINTHCEGTEKEGPSLKTQFELLKRNNIKYFIVFDELIDNDTDAEITNIQKRFHFENEKVYLMSKSEFPINGGVFNTKKRYHDFLEKLLGKNDIPLGYVNHLIIENGKLISFAPFLETNKLPIISK